MADFTTGAAVPVTINGVEYFMTPLSDENYEELDNWVRMRIVSIARASYTPDMRQADRDELMRQALESAASAVWASDLGARLTRTKDGIAKYLSVGLRVRHPECTHEWVRKLILHDDKALDALMDAWELANVPDARSNGDDAPKKA